MTPAPTDRQALAGAALAYHAHGAITPAPWAATQKVKAVTAAAVAGRALAKGERPVGAGRAKFVKVVGDTKPHVDLSVEVCDEVLTGAYDGLGAPAAGRITELAVAVFAGIAVEHAKQAHDNATWNDKLNDAKYPAAARVATALAATAATAATAAKAAGYAGGVKTLARLLVSAGMADDAMADAAQQAMNAPLVERGPAVIAYPAGMRGNKFGHPNIEAIEIYRAHGYQIEMYTTNTPVKNPSVGWVQPAVGDGTTLPAATISGAGGGGIITYDTR